MYKQTTITTLQNKCKAYLVCHISSALARVLTSSPIAPAALKKKPQTNRFQRLDVYLGDENVNHK